MSWQCSAKKAHDTVFWHLVVLPLNATWHRTTSTGPVRSTDQSSANQGRVRVNQAISFESSYIILFDTLLYCSTGCIVLSMADAQPSSEQCIARNADSKHPKCLQSVIISWKGAPQIGNAKMKTAKRGDGWVCLRTCLTPSTGGAMGTQ